jgi:hypothetical protein
MLGQVGTGYPVYAMLYLVSQSMDKLGQIRK